MVSVKELKAGANAAFKAGQWKKAIDLYSKVIEAEGENHLIYSNRSAAYVKAGLFEQALDDANKCVALEPGFSKGYGRKGVALHAMNRFDHAVAAYKEGLKLTPNDAHLEKGLAAAKRARVSNTSAAKAARLSDSTVKAQHRCSEKAKQASTVSGFLLQTKKELQLQMAAIQAKLDVINELGSLTQEGKADLIFSLIDKDDDGTIDANELAQALQKGLTQSSFREEVGRAAGTIAAFDKNGDALLDIEEFGDFLTISSRELGVSYDEFAEYLAIQLLTIATDAATRHVTQQSSNSSSENEESNDRSTAASPVPPKPSNSDDFGRTCSVELARHVNDDVLVELFKIFNEDGDLSGISFKDVATDLYRISADLSRPLRTTVEAMLTFDESDSRKLTYEQFSRLMLAFVVAAQTTFEELAEDLQYTRSIKDPVLDKEVQNLMISQDVYTAAKELQAKNPKHTIEALSYARLMKLFDLWDGNKDGDISFNELSQNLKKFQASVGVKGDATLLAMSLIGFDTDGDHQLDRNEFVIAMINYAISLKVSIHDLIDFCSLSTVLSKEDAKTYQSAFKESLMGAKKVIKSASQKYYEAAPEEFDFV